MVEIMRSMKKDSQERRANNRASSTDLLRADGVEFDERNAGAHLIVPAGRDIVDFWPGTGLWIVRGSPVQHRGVHHLLRYIKKHRPAERSDA